VYLTLLRHEIARALLGRAGRAVALDRIPVRRPRSRFGHLRNGTGAILDAGSKLAWRPPFVSVYYLTRASVHSELGYGLDELRRALRPPQGARGRALLATVPGVAAALVVDERTRRREQPVAAPAARAEAPAPSPPTPATVR